MNINSVSDFERWEEYLQHIALKDSFTPTLASNCNSTCDIIILWIYCFCGKWLPWWRTIFLLPQSESLLLVCLALHDSIRGLDLTSYSSGVAPEAEILSLCTF